MHRSAIGINSMDGNWMLRQAYTTTAPDSTIQTPAVGPARIRMASWLAMTICIDSSPTRQLVIRIQAALTPAYLFSIRCVDSISHWPQDTFHGPFLAATPSTRIWGVVTPFGLPLAVRELACWASD